MAVYTDACQKPKATTGPAKRLAALMGKRDRVTVAVQQDRTGVCACACVCVCVCVLCVCACVLCVCVCVCV